MGRETELLELAAAVSDGAAVNWREKERSAEDGEQRELIHNLRAVASIAEVHRTLDNGGSMANGRLDATTVTTPRLNDSMGEEVALAAWGHLERLEKIGEGAFGEVYRGWDPRLEREVALKLLRLGAPERASLGTRVIEEGRLLARVRHPHVVSVYGAERFAGRLGVWMEFVRGRTLSELLRDQGTFGSREADDRDRRVVRSPRARAAW